jgi:hypothetical protein
VAPFRRGRLITRDRIEWDSTEGHLQGSRQSGDFKPFLEAVQPFYNDIEEMTHYQITARATRVAR